MKIFQKRIFYTQGKMLHFIEECPMTYDIRSSALGNLERIQQINALLLLFSLEM